MRCAWIDAHRQEFALAAPCAGLEISVSGYRAWKKAWKQARKRGGTPERSRLTNSQMVALIRTSHANSRGAAMAAHAWGVNCGHAAFRPARNGWSG